MTYFITITLFVDAYFSIGGVPREFFLRQVYEYWRLLMHSKWQDYFQTILAAGQHQWH